MRTNSDNQTRNTCIDAEASSIARAALEGRIEERSARWQIAGLLEKAQVVAEVAATKFGHRGRGAVENATGILDDIIRDAITGRVATDGVGTTPPKLLLELLADGKSLCGWARKFARSPQAMSTCRRSAPSRREVTNVSPEAIEYQAYRRTPNETPTDPADIVVEATDADRIDEGLGAAALAALEASTRNLRSAGRHHVVGRVLCHVYDLPMPARAFDVAERDGILAIVESESGERVVRDALRGISDLPIAEIFDAYPDEALARLLAIDPHVGQELVIGALTPVPPPQTSHVSAMRRQLVGRLGASRRLSVLVTAFVALISESTTTEFDATHEFNVKPAEEREADRERFCTAVGAFVAVEGRLGTTPAEVERELTMVLDTIRFGAVIAA
ncbi:MAG: hypothetical protein ACYCR4_08465 [Acidimicrobiales bacterium]